MSPEIRATVRKLDKLIVNNKLTEALNQGIKAIGDFDKERAYEDSLELLGRLTVIAQENDKKLLEQEFISHSIIRLMLLGNKTEIKKLEEQLDDNFLPINSIVSSLLQFSRDNQEFKFHLRSVEKQSIFGGYEELQNIPVLNFDDEDDAIRIIEEYFPNGRYVINLIQIENSLHHSIDVDIGRPQEVNIVENRRVFRIK